MDYFNKLVITFINQIFILKFLWTSHWTNSKAIKEEESIVLSLWDIID